MFARTTTPVVLQIAARANAWSRGEVIAAISGATTGVALAFVVWWLVSRLPWPRPFRVQFALAHLAAVLTLGSAWFFASHALAALIGRQRIELDFDRLGEMVVIGRFFYILVAGVSYATAATARAGRAEAIAARTQLAALRAQIHPHFLFNALHTVVQLIPTEPARAAEAAELIADLLRSAVDEKRDEVTLADEWYFVSRYLAVEQIRFGSRLAVRVGIGSELLEERVPSFALQTLVENAVRHGAAPRVAPTEIVVTAAADASDLTLSVRNTGNGQSATNGAGIGSGLARLRERLAVLYGSAARLSYGPLADGNYEAVLVVPRPTGHAS